MAQLRGDRDPEIMRWRVTDAELISLSEALGRALSSSGFDGFVANNRIAFALGDAISYPKTGCRGPEPDEPQHCDRAAAGERRSCVWLSDVRFEPQHYSTRVGFCLCVGRPLQGILMAR